MLKTLKDSIKKCIPDYFFLKYLFYRKLGYKLNLKNPKSYNEKLQWLKLYDRNPLYTQLVDKYEVKLYVSKVLGEEYVIPNLGIWEKFDDIDFNSLPNQFVLKCTHDSGSVFVCKDKSTVNIDNAKKILENGLSKNFYWEFREWPYKNVKPRIIAEQYMIDEGKQSLQDYKVMCFNGEPKLIQVHSNSLDTIDKQDFYDIHWNRIRMSQKKYPPMNGNTEKPFLLEKMLNFSKILTQNIPQVRCDWYIINGKLYFGELTFFDAAGFFDFEPIEKNYELGEMINLNLAWKYKNNKFGDKID